eukprot:1971618-Karenia_brevis.AAC.1
MASGPLESEVFELPSSGEHMLVVLGQNAGFCAIVALPFIGRVFHHVYREDNMEADALATVAHVENLQAIRVTTARLELQPFGNRLQCCFDGSLCGKHGTGGWAVYVEILRDMWQCAAYASFPIK